MASKFPSSGLMQAALDQAHVAMLGGAPGPDKTLSFSACCLMMSNALAKAYAAGVASAQEPEGSRYHELMLRRAAETNVDYVPLNYKPDEEDDEG